MPYTAICSTYSDVGPALGECISHTLPYTAHTGMWGLLWGNVYPIHCHIQHIQGCSACSGGTVYAIHCNIQHIQGCGACSGGLYMPYTAIYSIYRDVAPVLEDCICHTMPYTAHTGMWGLLRGTLSAIHCHIQHIQGCGTCSGDSICHTLPYTAHTGMWHLLWGDCIWHTLPYAAHTGMWGLLRGTLYAIHCHIQHIKGCGACSGGLYMPYSAIYSTYRDVAPALGGLYMAYTAICSTYRDVAPALGGLYMAYTAICSTYRDVGPALGECISHTLPYTAYTGMWGLL